VNRMRSAIYSSLEPCRSLSRLLPLPDTVSLFNPSLSPVLLPLSFGLLLSLELDRIREPVERDSEHRWF
jgi:hypothetical protein